MNWRCCIYQNSNLFYIQPRRQTILAIETEKSHVNAHAKCVLIHITNRGQVRINRLVPVYKWWTLVWFASSICLMVQGCTKPIKGPKRNPHYSYSFCIVGVLSTNLVFNKNAPCRHNINRKYKWALKLLIMQLLPHSLSFQFIMCLNGAYSIKHICSELNYNRPIAT